MSKNERQFSTVGEIFDHYFPSYEMEDTAVLRTNPQKEGAEVAFDILKEFRKEFRAAEKKSKG
jgi:hypothetical protein